MKQHRTKKIQEVSGLIRELLNAGGLAERQLLAACWENKFKNVAKHTKLIALVDGKLKIKVDSSVWLQQIRMMQGDIRAVLNKKLKKEAIKEIQLITGDIQS